MDLLASPLAARLPFHVPRRSFATVYRLSKARPLVGEAVARLHLLFVCREVQKRGRFKPAWIFRACPLAESLGVGLWSAARRKAQSSELECVCAAAPEKSWQSELAGVQGYIRAEVGLRAGRTGDSAITGNKDFVVMELNCAVTLRTAASL